jgi:hypothetical protein
MGLLTRTLQKIFGATGGTGEFGEIGSDSEGSAVTTKNLTTIQALGSYDLGLFAITDNANEPPRIQDINALYFLFSSQLKYLFQEGIADYIATEEYYVNGLCKKAGIVYRSVTGTDGSPNINHNPAADTTHTYWAFASESMRQMEFNATALGLPFVATNQYEDINQKIALGHKVGEVVESMLNETPVAYSAAQSTAQPAYPEYNPIVPIWDADHVLAAANYPLLVPKLRAEKTASWSGAAYVTDHAVSVAGSVVTGSGVAWDALMAALTEDYVVHGNSYTDWRCINIAGTDYPIAGVNAGSHTCTVTGSPTTGAQTAIVYARRIAGSSTTARTYKDSGRVTMSQDGTLRISGLRRRFHMQGHWHESWPYSAGGAKVRFQSDSSGNAGTAATDSFTVRAATTDNSNGTPITGPETEPNSSTVYRSLWARTSL